MGFTVGAPILSLKPKQDGRKKRSGDLRKILDEMYERKGVDKDIDPNRRHLDRYLGKFKNADEAYNFYMDRFNNHKVIVKGKNGEIYERKPREDTSVAGNLILKPTAEEVNKMSFEDQQKLADDLIYIGNAILTSHGFKVDGVVVHNDEEGAHPHFVFHDDDFKISKKMTTKLYGDLNREVPKYLRSKGWECDDLRNYDVESTKNMSKEEKEEYTREFRKGKKYNGLSSQEYKKQQNKEKEQELQKLQEKIELEQRQKDEEFLRDIEEMGKIQRAALKKDKELEEKEKKLKELKLNVDSNIETMNSSAERADKSENDTILLNHLKSLKSKKYEGMSRYDEMIMSIESQKKAKEVKSWKDRSQDLRRQSDSLGHENEDKEIY